ncbi:hypothetical protein BDZ45DRAFT_807035 [Acephala macrosclerotiorum]|nr:hypothetical protein BDZ45DRAFT_807035 [Acephala macrosclerotiorum]
MANEEHKERSQLILLESNCKTHLDFLVPSSLVKPVVRDPHIIITVDSVSLRAFPHPTDKLHTIMVELETLKELSPNWLIFPSSCLHLDIDFECVPDDILPTILSILRGFGHVGSFGYCLKNTDPHEIKKDLRNPMRVGRVLEVLHRLEHELSQGASTIGGFCRGDIVSHALDCICHIFKWYDEPNYGYGFRDAFEKELDEKHRLELQRLEKSFGDRKKESARKEGPREGRRKSARLASQGVKPQGISKGRKSSKK